MELLLVSRGTRMGRENECFVVSSSDGCRRVPAAGVSSISLGRGVSVTSDALFLAIERGIPVVLIERSGAPAGRVWSAAYGSISTIRKGQLVFASGRGAVTWIKDTLVRKIGNQLALISILPPLMRVADSPTPEADAMRIDGARAACVRRMERMRDNISSAEADSVADVAASLRGWEGAASKSYFEAVNLFLPQPFRFERRSQHPARDVANAMLNYAYGILYAKVEAALVIAGIDPYVGVLHRDEYNRPVLAYDVIEVFRVWADYVVFSLLGQRAVNEDFATSEADGSVWLDDAGRRAVAQSLTDYLDEVVDFGGLRRGRATHIGLYASRLADTMRACVTATGG